MAEDPGKKYCWIRSTVSHKRAVYSRPSDATSLTPRPSDRGNPDHANSSRCLCEDDNDVTAFDKYHRDSGQIVAAATKLSSGLFLENQDLE